MSALVETMFSVRQTPWHHQGAVLADYPGTWPEARELAGLDWDPIIEPVYKLSGVDDQGRPVYTLIDGFNQVVRSDTAATLSVMGDGYTLIDHAAMGEIVESVLAQTGVKWETAGVLDGGKAVWCLCRLDEPIQLPGDDTATYPYLAITNRHDGRGACALRATAVRIVCMNTWRAAEMEGERTGATYSFRHSANWKDRIGDARAAVTGARTEMADYIKLAEELLSIPVTSRQRELFIRDFIPTPPDGLMSDRVAHNVDTARQAVRNILASVTTAHVADTAYGLVQAAGEYLDHVRTARTWESRLGRTLLRPEPLKARALSLARRVTDA